MLRGRSRRRIEIVTVCYIHKIRQIRLGWPASSYLRCADPSISFGLALATLSHPVLEEPLKSRAMLCPNEENAHVADL